MIKVIADQNLYKIAKFLPEQMCLTLYDPNRGLPDVSGYDAWLVRTVTKVNSCTFPVIPPSLKFVGTGSSGSDHVEIPYLQQSGITFGDALGCNSRAVAEYVVTALLQLLEYKSVDFRQKTIGIVGVGHAGSALNNLLITFGCSPILYDPPRAQRDESFISSTLEDVLECDILSFHTNFTRTGEFPTQYWLDEKKLENRSFDVIINAARGGIVKENVVMNAFDRGQIGHLITDVWENEPDINPEMAARSFIATPHIAGYSEESKLDATRLVCDKLCAFFEVEPPLNGSKYPKKSVTLPKTINNLAELLHYLHPLSSYETSLRKLIDYAEKGNFFSRLRTERPYHNEFQYLKIEDSILHQFPELELLGITSIND